MEQQLINMERPIRQSHARHLIHRIAAEDSFGSGSVDTLASSMACPRKTADGVGDFPDGTWPPHGCVNGGGRWQNQLPDRNSAPLANCNCAAAPGGALWKHPERGSANGGHLSVRWVVGIKCQQARRRQKSMCTAFQIIRCGTRTAHRQNP